MEREVRKDTLAKCSECGEALTVELWNNVTYKIRMNAGMEHDKFVELERRVNEDMDGLFDSYVCPICSSDVYITDMKFGEFEEWD